MKMLHPTQALTAAPATTSTGRQAVKRSPSILKTPSEEKRVPVRKMRRRLSYHPSVLLWDAAENDDPTELLHLLQLAKPETDEQRTDAPLTPDSSYADIDLNMANHEGLTLLHLCSFTGRASCVRMLLSLGADPNRSDQEGWAPLHVAAAARHLDVIQELLRGGARTSLKSEDDFLGIASVTADREVLKLCRKPHADKRRRLDSEEASIAGGFKALAKKPDLSKSGQVTVFR